MLRKLCPLEAELLKDPTIKAKVRFRLIYIGTLYVRIIIRIAKKLILVTLCVPIYGTQGLSVSHTFNKITVQRESLMEEKL